MEIPKPIISSRPLNDADTRILKKNVYGVFTFLIIAVIFFWSVLPADFLRNVQPSTYIFGSVLLFIFGIVCYMLITGVRDLFHGEKIVVTGVVTDKLSHRPSKGGRKKSRSKPTYYLLIGEKKYLVNYGHYTEAMVGDRIELHRARFSKTSLGIIPKSHVRSEEKSTDNIESINSESFNLKKEKPMSQEDFSKLKKQRNKQIGIYFFFVPVLFFMIVAFGIASFLWWPMTFGLVFLISLFVFFLRKTLRHLKVFRKDADARLKIVMRTRILDKQRYSGRASGWFIRTDAGVHAISQYLYEIIQGKEEAIISTGKYTGWLIDIQTKSTVDFYSDQSITQSNNID